jgi:hypothetical protein
MPIAPKPKEITGSELATGKVKLFPKQPVVNSPERIRPELNLEKWPAIWQPAKSKNQPVERKLRREVTLTDGKSVVAEVEVGFTNKGTLTTEDQKTYYALIKHWEETGQPEDRPVYFSLKHLAKLLTKKWGTNVIEALTQSLIRLRITPLIWTNSYRDSGTNQTVEALEPFNILAELKIIRTKIDGHVTRQAGYFRFNDYILRNLHSNLTKPVLFETVISFKGEIAQILYTYLDLILSDKTLFERRTKELFEDLGLEGKAYRNPSNRKQVLAKALGELQGVPLTTGRIASITLEETKDEKDYKLVVRKGKLVAVPKINYYQEKQTTEPRSDEAPAEEREVSSAGEPPSPQKPHNEELLNQARELVAYFYQVFHSDKNFQINSKALGQAISLITKHGLEPSRYIVDYAHHEAPKTNFDIQTFGGVIQYSARALADFERRRIHQEQAARLRVEHEVRLQYEIEQQRREQAAKERAQAYLDQLPTEEHQALYDECAEQYKTSEFYRAHYNTQTVQSAIRMLMLRRIIAEQEMFPDNETVSETASIASGEPVEIESDQPNG